MKTAILIPARYASSRYPGKPLALLRGAEGEVKSLIHRSWEAALAVQGVDFRAVLTDDGRIAEAAQGFGAPVILTSPDCANGTERCAEALDALAGPMGTEPDLVVNLQGDAPLTPPWFVEALIEAMAAEPDIAVATPVLRCDAEALAGFREDRAAGRVGGTTAVFDAGGRALYFSKEVLPYIGRALAEGEPVPVFHHVGVYAYRPDALRAYAAAPSGRLERWEGLEQLRFMEHGTPVHCIEVDARGAEFWELNNPEDIARVETALMLRGIA